MSTDPFPNTPYNINDNKNIAGKRKRDSMDATAGRGAPNTRLPSDHTGGHQHMGDGLSAGPAHMADMTGATYNSTNGGHHDNSTNQFDFDLQQGQSKAVGAGPNIDEAAASLNHQYPLDVTRHGAPGFPNQQNNEGDDSTFLDNSTYPEIDASTTNYQDGELPVVNERKPHIGSDEWLKVRKDNHKEVERRRRETINEGINELAKIVPGCEKNKGSILSRAVQYITKLQDDANTNIDKWTFEKLVTDQAINEISEKLTRTYHEKEAWKKLAREAGVDVDNVDLGINIAPSVPKPVAGSVDVGTADAKMQSQAQQTGRQIASQAVESATATTAQMQGSGMIDPQVDVK